MSWINSEKHVAKTWPRKLPQLSAEQLHARELFMKLWHEILPKKYGLIEKFNHGYPASLPYPSGGKTLEIGAGLGEHSKFENLNDQEYYLLEYREEFCKTLRTFFPADRVVAGDIHQKQPWDDSFFNRIIAVHVLEHLDNLPAALSEVNRLLKPDGYFDVVLPCEGGIAYRLAREISAKRVFEKNFKMSYLPIIRNEHVSTLAEIVTEMKTQFDVVESKYFPLRIPIPTLNLVAGIRFRKKRR